MMSRAIPSETPPGGELFLVPTLPHPLPRDVWFSWRHRVPVQTGRFREDSEEPKLMLLCGGEQTVAGSLVHFWDGPPWGHLGGLTWFAVSERQVSPKVG